MDGFVVIGHQFQHDGCYRQTDRQMSLSLCIDARLIESDVYYLSITLCVF